MYLCKLFLQLPLSFHTTLTHPLRRFGIIISTLLASSVVKKGGKQKHPRWLPCLLACLCDERQNYSTREPANFTMAEHLILTLPCSLQLMSVISSFFRFLIRMRISEINSSSLFILGCCCSFLLSKSPDVKGIRSRNENLTDIGDEGFCCRERQRACCSL